jgi:tRNA(Arg) A34 adenosine deaminase TadA
MIFRAIKKASYSACRHKVSAIGFNGKGEMIYSSFNKRRFNRKGGNFHAEMNVMRVAGKALKTIIICRVNNHGNLLPIDPCKVCAEKAKELGVKIITIEGDMI